MFNCRIDVLFVSFPDDQRFSVKLKQVIVSKTLKGAPLMDDDGLAGYLFM